jgi:hypothetical protein
MSTPDTTVGAKQLLTTTRAVRDPATRGNFGLTESHLAAVLERLPEATVLDRRLL